MMLHVVLTAALRVFILEGVVTMWARGHNLLPPPAGKRLDIRLGKLLKEEFTTDTPGGITGATLFWAEHRKIHAGVLKQLGGRPCNLLCPWIKRGGATDPEQILEVGIRFDHWHVEPPCPVQPLRVGAPVGVRLVANLLQRSRRRPRKLPFSNQMATHIAYQIDLPD